MILVVHFKRFSLVIQTYIVSMCPGSFGILNIDMIDTVDPCLIIRCCYFSDL